MRSVPLLLIISLAACSRSQADASALPPKFILRCNAPNDSTIPDSAKMGFDVAADRTTNQFSMPWWNRRSWPIAKIEANEIVLMDDHIEQGVDNNPEDRRITFDRRTGTLHFYEAYDALVPVRTEFTSHCEIANA